MTNLVTPMMRSNKMMRREKNKTKTKYGMSPNKSEHYKKQRGVELINN